MGWNFTDGERIASAQDIAAFDGSLEPVTVANNRVRLLLHPEDRQCIASALRDRKLASIFYQLMNPGIRSKPDVI